MYLEEAALRRLLCSVAKILRHSESRLWVDVVARAVVDGTSGQPGVESFVSGMARLGEPFVFGLDQPAKFFIEFGLESVHATASSGYLSGKANPIFDLYTFHVLRRRSGLSAMTTGSPALGLVIEGDDR
jgi:hypothetical protein